MPKAVVMRVLTSMPVACGCHGSALEKAVEAAEEYLARLAPRREPVRRGEQRKTLMDADIAQRAEQVG